MEHYHFHNQNKLLIQKVIILSNYRTLAISSTLLPSMYVFRIGRRCDALGLVGRRCDALGLVGGVTH